MKGFLKRLPLALLVLAFLSFCSVFAAVILNDLFATHIIKVRNFEECLELVKDNEKCFKWWGLLELLSLSMTAFLLFIRHDYYTSRLIRITDKIHIPEACGQGQHGTAHFMSKRNIRKRYKPLQIKEKDPLICELLEMGKQIKIDVKQFIKSEKEEGKKIRRIERKLKKEERKKKKHKSEKWQHFEKCLKQRTQDVIFSLFSLRIVRIMKDNRERLTDRKYRKEALKPYVSHHVEDYTKPYFKQGGLVIGTNKDGTKIYCILNDKHALIVGSTGAGKSRRMVIPTVCTLALAGESMVITDPKGEVYAYTCAYLKKLGYQVIKMDFFDTTLSSSINPLQPVIDAVNEDNLSLATSRAWDMTSFLVEKSDKGEPIWQNGEASVIAAAILCVVCDNRDQPQYQNLTNVYSFIAEMSKDVKEGEATYKPIVRYIEQLPDEHPAKALMGISNVAPSRTAGSFYTSALTSLRLFTSEEIYNITNKSHFKFNELGSKKQVLFFVLPDSKTTYYPIVSLFCSQIYDTLTEGAKRNGNQLDRRVNFILDEFGNFTKLANFETMLTVGRGYGIRFNLFIQSFAQLEAKYEKTGAQIIKDNCIWIYLNAGNNETNKEFEERLGKYTTSGYSLGNDTKRNAQPSASSNVSLMGRSLLETDELRKISSPYLLVSEQQSDPAVLTLPDLSKWKYNKMLGLGGEKYNQDFIKYIIAKQIPNEQEKIKLWGIWNNYIIKKGQNKYETIF